VKRAALFAVALVSGCCFKCLEAPPGSTTFGRDVPSTDGKTYLTVAKDGVGKGCVLVLDGKRWSSLDAKTPVTPGTHIVGCEDGESMELDVAAGHDVLVDYWGP
jgi:hypothetical protein